MADWFCGIAADDGVGRYIFDDNGTGSDDGIVADGDARIDDGTAADPDIMADDDGFAEFFAGIAGDRIERMSRCVNVDPRRNHAIVANPDFTDVQKDTVEIGIEVVADMDVKTVIAAKIRFNMDQFAG